MICSDLRSSAVFRLTNADENVTSLAEVVENARHSGFITTWAWSCVVNNNNNNNQQGGAWQHTELEITISVVYE